MTDYNYALDHGEAFDNHITEDTLRESAEEIAARQQVNTLSFWGDSFAWQLTKAALDQLRGIEAVIKTSDSEEAVQKANHNKQALLGDASNWIALPTSTLVGSVINLLPAVVKASKTQLETKFSDELNVEKERHLDFLRTSNTNDTISESVDLLSSYTKRVIEQTQRFNGMQQAYERISANPRSDEERKLQAKDNYDNAARELRHQVAKLEALRHAYHEVITDENAWSLTYDFDPKTEADRARLRRQIDNTLGLVAWRLGNSAKEGRIQSIPLPWKQNTEATAQRSADEMLDVFAAA